MKRRTFLGTLAQAGLGSLPVAREALAAAAPAADGPGRAAPAAPAAGSGASSLAGHEAAAVAFYYGDDIPFDDLAAFDAVVLQPGPALAETADIGRALGPYARAFAYVSVGEVASDDPLARRIPPQWFAGSNTAWGTRVLDQTAAGWSRFLREQIVAPLWQAGFRGLFLDTLDSYQLIAHDAAQRARQSAALAATLHELVAAFPGLRLILNRGFDLVDSALAASIDAVAAESLYRGWRQDTQAYVPVAAADRSWLLQRFQQLRARFGLPGIAIDYCAPEQRARARRVARAIAAQGLIPWVADAGLQGLGVGAVELVPRRALLLHSCAAGNAPALQSQSAHIYGAMPLEQLGLVPEYRYIGAAFGDRPLAGRYAAIVVYPDRSEVPQAVREMLLRAQRQGVPVAVFGSADPQILGALGATVGSGQLAGPLAMRRGPGTPPGEVLPLLDPLNTVDLQAPAGSTAWLSAVGSDGRVMQGAALTPWGGYALGAFGVFNLPGGSDTRWSIDPIAFLHAALRVGDDPMPDVTTRYGRRVLIAHFDGDGWPNACLRPGSPIAGQVLVSEILERYRIPTVGSIIVGEVSDHGEYPSLAPVSRHWARRMYALPWVEAGSHTWAHPFDWVLASRYHARFPTGDGEQAYGNYLPLPDYRFSTASNVTGAKEYIEKNLCPPGKTCDIILWPGDCNPTNKAVAMAYQAGMANLNGGGATISRTAPTLSNVWPLGIPKGAFFQVYAACSNEETYTHNWRGPYFGFERAIETYRMTDLPRRLKPIDIYYHPYIVTQPAGLASLHKVYRWVLAQPVHPIFGRQYAHSVNAWRSATVARRLDGGWRLRGGEHLLQWVQPASAQPPRLDACRAIVGWNEHADRRYLHGLPGQALLRLGGPEPARPMLVDANADVLHWSVADDGSVRLRLQGFVAIDARLRLPAGWTLQPVPGLRVLRRRSELRLRSTASSVDIVLQRA